MRFFTLLLLTMFLSYSGFSQEKGKAVPKMIETYKDAGVTFTPVDLFQNNRTSIDGRDDIEEVVSKATILKINPQAFRSAISANHSAISLPIPSLYRQDLVLELVQVDIFAAGFQVTTSEGNVLNGEDLGLHYRGIIKGIENSLVAISIYKNEISGFIADATGNIVLGKIEGRNPENEHILYLDRNMKVQSDFECSFEDDGTTYPQQDFQLANTSDPGDCVGIYVEADKNIYDSKGGEAGAITFVTGLFNQSAALFANEQITIGLSDLFIWTTSSPYGGGNSITYMTQFHNYRTSFDGDLGHLISIANLGGVAPGLNGICNPSLSQNMCFSGIESTYNELPTWSWTVSVFTHEMGHLFGSNHTHDCVWNGNNTAIDGCYNTSGGCANPGNPPSGSIMSYCHLNGVGVDFANGFLLQPGNVIRARVANATCLNTHCDGDPCKNGVLDNGEITIDCGGICPSCTCDDGILNQGEEGVDCGGPCPNVCPPCTNLTLNLVLDDYPEETSWRVELNGAIVASGGSYENEADGASVTENICLEPNICYNFIMQDLYQDGMCCGYGQGSYELVLDATGAVLASGGEFANSETTEICIEPSACMEDGVMNGDETGVDCGGPACPACPTCDDDMMNGDETGVDCGGPDCSACPTCNDGMMNGNETGVDCGGPDCNACPATCDDGMMNGNETGVDCGGPDCDPCPDCPPIDLNVPVSAYGNGQDNGDHHVTNGYIVVYNNAWKSIDKNYTVTANTVLEFDFGSTIEGEIHGIGFDNNSGYSSAYTFQVHGTQNWGVQAYHNYSDIGYWVTYAIPVGQHYGGTMNRLFFLADQDAGAENGNSYFRNIKIYEGNECSTSMPRFGEYIVGEKLPDDSTIKARAGAADVLAKTVLFPNPTEDVLNVQLAPEFVNGKMTIVDLYGKIIMTQSVTGANMKLNVADLNAGMYFLQLQNGAHKQVAKFVVGS